MTARVRKAYFKHAAPQSERSRHYCMHLRVCMSVSKSVWVCVCVFKVYVHIISLTILLQYFYTSGRTVSCIIVSLNLEKSNVYLIVLFFVAEKTVQKMYNERYQTHFLISLPSIFFKNGM